MMTSGSKKIKNTSWWGSRLLAGFFWALSACLLLELWSTALWSQSNPALEQSVREILERNCLNCHGSAQTSGLDLRQRETIVKGGKRGPAIVPGNADGSLLYQAVSGTGELKMPPGKSLAVSDLDKIRSWINSGAPWQRESRGPAQSSWWAFQKPVCPSVPKVKNEQWVRNPIDSFILSKLEEKKLNPVSAADRRTLIRRAYFDLLGLPPSFEEVEKFVSDPALDSYKKLIDHLLESPRYGERWGRHWLDVVRYADTGGFETDIYFPNAWRYRDYVIKSFNDDKRFDRFVQEQIAGDELWPDNLDLAGSFDVPPEKLSHLEARIGTGLYTVGPVYHEAALNGEQLRYEWLSDAVDTTGEAFLGLTFGCARCHDHKFDPLSQRDYYRMMAIFSGSEEKEIPVVPRFDIFSFKSGFPELLRVEDYQAAIQRLDRKTRERAIGQVKSRFSREIVDAYELPEAKRSEVQKQLAMKLEQALTSEGLRQNAAGKMLDPPYTADEKAERERLIYELGKATLKASINYPTATVLGHSDVVPDVYVAVRGEFRQKAEKVTPGLPAVLADGRILDEPAQGPSMSQRRKALAVWLTGPDHPLTSRVMINRIWQWHFGKGIVGTPNDFGRQGEAPTHPELLDWLASEFSEKGWSMKSMHRLIMLSNTYQMSSQSDRINEQIDPENRFLWRANRRRLEAEALRDSVLAVAGSLNLKMGGRPVIPTLTREEKSGLWSADQWPVSLDPEEHNRRSVYLYVKRSFPYPMFVTFDMPDTSVSCPRREATTVAPQALAMLNSDFMMAQAERLASRLQKECGDAPERWVDVAWKLAFNRLPSQLEREKALEFLSKGHRTGEATTTAESTQSAEPMAFVELCLVLFNANEFVYVD
jgi:Protein of unknown function (DUF1553)/Protein of unknown function (DUF1549)/Planctomycete cytochrome C